LKNLLRLLISGTLVMALYSCTRYSPHYQDSIIPINYKSQKDIIRQEYTMVHSPYGALSAVVFGYDRNGDRAATRTIKANRRGIDLLEAKLLTNPVIGTGIHFWYWSIITLTE